MNTRNMGSLWDEMSKLGPSEYEGRVLSTTQRRSERNDRRFLQTMWGLELRHRLWRWLPTFSRNQGKISNGSDLYAYLTMSVFMWFRITTRHADDKSSVLRGEDEWIVSCAERKTKKNSVCVKINFLNLNQIHRMTHSFVLKRTGIQIWAWR